MGLGAGVRAEAWHEGWARLRVGARRGRLQLGEHMALAEVGEVDEAVGLRGAEARGGPLEGERDDEIDGRVLGLPVGQG